MTTNPVEVWINRLQDIARHYPDQCKLQYGGDSIYSEAVPKEVILRILALAEVGFETRAMQERLRRIPSIDEKEMRRHWADYDAKGETF